MPPPAKVGALFAPTMELLCECMIRTVEEQLHHPSMVPSNTAPESKWVDGAFETCCFSAHFGVKWCFLGRRCVPKSSRFQANWQFGKSRTIRLHTAEQRRPWPTALFQDCLQGGALAFIHQQDSDISCWVSVARVKENYWQWVLETANEFKGVENFRG